MEYYLLKWKRKKMEILWTSDLRLIDKCYMKFDGDEQSKGQKWNDVWRRLDIQNSETSQHEANESLLTLNNKWDDVSWRKVGWKCCRYLRWKTA